MFHQYKRTVTVVVRTNMENTEKFIECVKKNPCLWNVNLHSYRCSLTKDNAWRKIIHETGIDDIKKAKGMWKNLRDCFRESLKKQREVKSGQISKKIRPYKYHYVLEFLLPTFEDRDSTSNFNTGHFNSDSREISLSPGNSTQNMETAETPDESDLSQNTTENIQTLHSLTQHCGENACFASKRRKNNQNYVLNFLEEDSRKRDARAEKRQQLMEQILNKEDPMDKFFLSMSDSTKQLPQPLQLQVKRKVFNAVIEAEESYSINSWYNLNYGCTSNSGELSNQNCVNMSDSISTITNCTEANTQGKTPTYNNENIK